MEHLFTAEALTALLTLSFMEIVLGIDNIIFVAIIAAKAAPEKQAFTRNLGISLALILRLGLLFSISWVMSLKNELFVLFDHSFSARDLILIFGGLFLIGKSTFEIHDKVENAKPPEERSKVGAVKSMGSLILQILALDIIFSLDSVITAVGMAKDVSIMVIAMLIAMVVMLASAKHVSGFVDKHPTIKILALSFLILIGVVLVVEGMGGHVGKGYIYFAMFFSLAVELVNMRYRTKTNGNTNA